MYTIIFINFLLSATPTVVPVSSVEDDKYYVHAIDGSSRSRFEYNAIGTTKCPYTMHHTASTMKLILIASVIVGDTSRPVVFVHIMMPKTPLTRSMMVFA
jgi:hypothetical protein